MEFAKGPQSPEVAARNSEREKRAYARPVLVVFGSVVKLTQNIAGSGADGGSATQSMLP
jgi:hypothetical protein